MRQTTALTASSVLSVVLVTFHVADDIVLKLSPAGLENLIGVAILVVWLYGTLALAERRTGYVVVLLGSIFGLVVPIIHMRAAGGLISPEIGMSGGAFFFVWTLLGLSVSAALSIVLSARALWSLPWRSPAKQQRAGGK